MDKVKNIQAIFFDVFGTVFDWHKSIYEETKKFSFENNLSFDEFIFTDKWRSGFRFLQSKVASGERDYLSMDDIHMEVLNELLNELDIESISKEKINIFNQAWHRLYPWEDSLKGLEMLKNKFLISALSNGNLSMLVKLSKNSKIEWDSILSTEFFGTYKPDPKVYLGANNLLGIDPNNSIMVACHAYDLDGASKAGMKTCYVHRPNEFGNGKSENYGDLSRFDIVVESFEEIINYIEG
ncbi:MAG: haloacid dehalogenase type II [Dehalococcoidia bacterium]|nr:haloacid dehalogenase type II [Dehalococcoidia bacterium]|tara:strand:- start:6255 stop:6971 length:717 start_codon:yes stop_codon:yes gene_type:complete